MEYLSCIDCLLYCSQYQFVSVLKQVITAKFHDNLCGFFMDGFGVECCLMWPNHINTTQWLWKLFKKALIPHHALILFAPNHMNNSAHNKKLKIIIQTSFFSCWYVYFSRNSTGFPIYSCSGDWQQRYIAEDPLILS